ncbi:hypothetical protein VSR17_17455, partial [Cupriavidus taiwanensis]|uniref:hypothetical protein n=1 Tax=Cupriavidus taiwanensis TaxID=164546 RepID=UPI00317756EF
SPSSNPVLAASCDPAHIPLIPEETDISIQNVLFRATVFCEEPKKSSPKNSWRLDWHCPYPVAVENQG